MKAALTATSAKKPAINQLDRALRVGMTNSSDLIMAFRRVRYPKFGLDRSKRQMTLRYCGLQSAQGMDWRSHRIKSIKIRSTSVLACLFDPAMSLVLSMRHQSFVDTILSPLTALKSSHLPCSSRSSMLHGSFMVTAQELSTIMRYSSTLPFYNQQWWL